MANKLLKESYLTIFLSDKPCIADVEVTFTQGEKRSCKFKLNKNSTDFFGKKIDSFCCSSPYNFGNLLDYNILTSGVTAKTLWK